MSRTTATHKTNRTLYNIATAKMGQEDQHVFDFRLLSCIMSFVDNRTFSRAVEAALEPAEQEETNEQTK
jgi:hypothetical protein